MINLDEVKNQIRMWKPTCKYYFDIIKICDLNMYPCKRYVAYVRDNTYDNSLKYWLDRIKKDWNVTPIIVEKTKLRDDNNKVVDWYFIRDGIHRFSAMELLWKKEIPAIILTRWSSRLTRNFNRFSDNELNELWLEKVYK